MNDKFDVMLTGVGGKGVLTAGVILSRAAQAEGKYVRGVQLHGLAQRGGTIPTFVRFGEEEEVNSPGIMQADADLVMAFEPLEAVRAVFYARKEKTSFVINDYSFKPIHADIMDIDYPSMNEITERIEPFAKEIDIYSSDELAEEKFGDIIYGNTVLIGAALGSGKIPLQKESVEKAIESTLPRSKEENIEAFRAGIEIARK